MWLAGLDLCVERNNAKFPQVKSGFNAVIDGKVAIPSVFSVIDDGAKTEVFTILAHLEQSCVRIELSIKLVDRYALFSYALFSGGRLSVVAGAALRIFAQKAAPDAASGKLAFYSVAVVNH